MYEPSSFRSHFAWSSVIWVTRKPAIGDYTWYSRGTSYRLTSSADTDGSLFQITRWWYLNGYWSDELAVPADRTYWNLLWWSRHRHGQTLEVGGVIWFLTLSLIVIDWDETINPPLGTRSIIQPDPEISFLDKERTNYAMTRTASVSHRVLAMTFLLHKHRTTMGNLTVISMSCTATAVVQGYL
jgi:hypothetical protein